MRMLERNKTPFYYALFVEKRPMRRDNGQGELLETGESEIIYSGPIPAYGNISAARGETQTRQFGEDIGYDKVIILDETPIDEYSVLWIDTEPTTPDGTAVPHDYIVKKVARCLNNVAIAVSRVRS